MKHAVRYNKKTGQITGIIGVAIDSDLELNRGPDEELIEIEPNHPVCGEQKKWCVKNGKLERKPQSVIDKEEQEEKERMKRTRAQDPLLNVLLNEINSLRTALGKPAITPEDIINKIDNIKNNSTP